MCLNALFPVFSGGCGRGQVKTSVANFSSKIRSVEGLIPTCLSTVRTKTTPHPTTHSNPPVTYRNVIYGMRKAAIETSNNGYTLSIILVHIVNVCVPISKVDNLLES